MGICATEWKGKYGGNFGQFVKFNMNCITRVIAYKQLFVKKKQFFYHFHVFSFSFSPSVFVFPFRDSIRVKLAKRFYVSNLFSLLRAGGEGQWRSEQVNQGMHRWQWLAFYFENFHPTVSLDLKKICSICLNMFHEFKVISFSAF